jgi:hypothetical protein
VELDEGAARPGLKADARKALTLGLTDDARHYGVLAGLCAARERLADAGRHLLVGRERCRPRHAIDRECPTQWRRCGSDT